MIGIEVVKDRATGDAYPAQMRMGHRVILEARARGVIIRPLSDIVVLMPPLSITGDEMRTLVGVTAESIAAAVKGA